MIELGAALLILTFAALLLLNVPVAFAVGVAALVALLAVSDINVLTTLAQRMTAGVDSFALLAIPFFILAGNIMVAGGLAKRLIDAARALVGWLPGGLSLVNVVACLLFGAISGSAVAAISSIGSVMTPALEDEGEDRPYAAALCATAGTTGLLIPPSNVMIVYAVVAQCSIAALFFAGVVPGLLVGVMLMAAALLVRRPDPTQAAAARDASQRVDLRQTIAALLLALPSLSLIFLVLGGILSGVFSATEAAAVSVLLALLVGGLDWGVQRVTGEVGPHLTWTALPQLLFESTRTTAIVLFLIATSQSMSWVLSYLQIPQSVAAGMLMLSDNPVVLMIIINITLLLVGTFLDITPAVLLFTPIFLPVATSIGLDPIHFGIVMILNLCIGLCTPPVGTCLFVGCSVAGVSIAQMSRRMIPFIIAMLVALGLTTSLPQLSTWLPRAMGLLDAPTVTTVSPAPAANLTAHVSEVSRA
jgi:tripartite ATP-independent transporter DctM subunit